MSLGWLFLPFIVNFYLLGTELYKYLFERKPFWWAGLMLSIPAILNVIYYVYANFHSDPSSCTAVNPGPCFSYGIFVGGLLFPFAVITSLLFVILFFRRKNAKRPRYGI